MRARVQMDRLGRHTQGDEFVADHSGVRRFVRTQASAVREDMCFIAQPVLVPRASTVKLCGGLDAPASEPASARAVGRIGIARAPASFIVLPHAAAENGYQYVHRRCLPRTSYRNLLQNSFCV